MRKICLLLTYTAACSDNTFGTVDSQNSGITEEPSADASIEPDMGTLPCQLVGENCEFDTECCDTEQCVEGTCKPRPKVPACGSASECPKGMACLEGECVDDPGCDDDTDCPSGEVCLEGVCSVPPEPPANCEDDDPSLAGTWLLDSTLYLGEGISGFTDTVLGAADSLEGYLCPLVPPFACSIIGLLGDLNDMLSTMYVNQRITLSPTGVGTYTGTEIWASVGFVIDGVYYTGTPADIYAWEIDADDFTARTCAGQLIIDSHRVRMNFCNIVRWAVDAAVFLSSDGAYFSLSGLVFDMCGDLGFPLSLACTGFVSDALDDILGCGGLSLLAFDYSGTATIASDELIYEGVWTADLDPGDTFPGLFTGEKE